MKKSWIAVAAIAAVCAAQIPNRYNEPETVQAEEKPAEEEAETSELPMIDLNQPVLPGARIAVVSKNTKGAFWETVRLGMEDALAAVNEAYGYTKSKKLTMTFEGAKDEMDIETQINTLDAVVSENPAVICMSASDMASCQAQLEAARENGIPVVVFDSKLEDMQLVSAYCSTDNISVGRIAGEKLLSQLPNGGEVAVFSAQSKSSSVQERVQGFLEVMNTAENISVLPVIYQDEVEDLDAEMQRILEEYPNLAGVYCTNYEVTERYLSLEKEETFPVLIGTDGSKAQSKAILAGEEYGTVSQDPYLMGYQTMLTAIDLTKLPGTVLIEREQLLDAIWLDAGNMEAEENQKYIY